MVVFNILEFYMDSLACLSYQLCCLDSLFQPMFLSLGNSSSIWIRTLCHGRKLPDFQKPVVLTLGHAPYPVERS